MKYNTNIMFQVSIVSNPVPLPETDEVSVHQMESRAQSESTVLPSAQPLHK